MPPDTEANRIEMLNNATETLRFWPIILTKLGLFSFANLNKAVWMWRIWSSEEYKTVGNRHSRPGQKLGT